jgi:hypothetical protein
LTIAVTQFLDWIGTDEIEITRRQSDRAIREEAGKLRADNARLQMNISWLPSAVSRVDADLVQLQAQIPPRARPYSVPQLCDRQCESIMARDWRDCALSAFPKWQSDRLASVLEGDSA